MIYIQSAFSQEEQRLELVGRQGEGGTRQLVFDCADVLAEYPDALIVCAMQRAGDRTAYLKDCATDGTNRAVTLESADVAVPGILKIELRALIGDDVRKSAVYIAKVAESLRGAQDKPGNPIADVLNRIDMTISRAEESIAEADAAAKSAQTVADIVQEKLDNGEFVGPAGKDGANGKDGAPGSDASVTAENIQAALGYTPVKDVQVFGNSVLDGGVAKVPLASADVPGVVKILRPQDSGIWNDNGSLRVSFATDEEISGRSGTRKAIVCANMDYAVKAAMCDGKGAAWAAIEQKAARERMGVDKEYELIEEITLTENVTQIIRTDEPDGTAYAFEGVAIKINRTNTGEGVVYVYSGSTVVGWSYLSKSGQYFACETFSLHGYWQNYRYSASSGHNDYGGIVPTGDSRFLKIKKVAGQYVSKIQITLSNAELGIGTKISIYGVRA